MEPDLHAMGVRAHRLGLCVLPPREDGSKQPDVSTWTCYQATPSTQEEIARWYATDRRTGIGLVCGAVSGHLELFEFDDEETYERFLELAEEAGLGPLVVRIRAGYEERTPGGGIHWLLFLLEGGARTVALARRMGLDRTGKPIPLPLIETKGEGGYVVIAPSHGGVHPTGNPYVLRSGGLETIASITPEERDALWSLARSLDEIEPPPGRERQPTSGARWLLRPGDDLNARATWDEILEPHGWEEARTKGEVTYWRRPGGYAGGWGASTNHTGSDLLRVWTTAAPPLEADKSITKFTAFALLNHGGDYAAAARELEAQGYGQRRPTFNSGSGTSGSDTPPPLLVPVPPFPVEALPPVARAFVTEGAAALGCPPDFVVVPLFAFIGAVAGNSRKLRLKLGFELEPIFWSGVIGKPGTVKTPALNLSRRLLDVLQKETWTAFTDDFDAWLEAKPAERGPKPRPEHFFATDTTTEAIAFALQTSRGIAVIHDELAGWVLAFDNYKKGGDRQAWLSAWSAAPLKPNRKTGEPIYIPEPVVCVVGGIQPAVLPDLAGEAARDDGFVPRLLLAWPDAEPSPWTDAVLAQEAFDAMLAVVRRLRLRGEEAVVTRLSDGAKAEWVGWYEENRLLTGAARGLTAGWAAKAPVHLARIALVLHLLAHAADRDRALSAGTMRDAIAVVEYFRAHLGRVLPSFGATPPAGGAGLPARVRRILADAAPGWVARTEVGERLGGHVPAADIGAALEALEARGLAERRSVATGGRTREEWRATEPDDEEDAPEKTGKDEKSRDEGDADDLSPSFPVSPHAHFADGPDPDGAWETWEEAL